MMSLVKYEATKRLMIVTSTHAMAGENQDPWSDDPEGQGTVLADREAETKQPRQFKVLLHNDDYTPMEFVIEVLESFFKKNHTEATEIMLAVHHKGIGVCGIFPYAVAETKVAQVMEAARAAEHPLQCTMEPA